MKRYIGGALLIALNVLVLNAVVELFFVYLRSKDQFYAALARFPDIDVLAQIYTYPAGVLFLAVVCLALEVRALGFAGSSAKRLWNHAEDHSAKDDLFYFGLEMFSLVKVVGFVLSLGIGYYGNELLARHLTGHIDFSRYPPVLQFAFLCFLNPLTFYWHHRLLHTPLLWPFHKVHHAPTELNVINSLREHPCSRAIQLFTRTMPPAIFGVSPMVILVYEAINGFYQFLAHSRMDWGRGFVGKYLIINPSRHRLHHGTDPGYWNINYGVLPVWDRLFGTWRDLKDPKDLDLRIGFDKEPFHNEGRNYLRCLLGPYRQVLKNLP